MAAKTVGKNHDKAANLFYGRAVPSTKAVKKSHHSTGQATLFQSWNKQPKTTKKQGLFQTWDTTNSSCSTTSDEKQTTVHQRKHETQKSLNDIVNFDDDDEDNELIASIDESVLCQDTDNSHDVGNLSFSASNSTNDDGGDMIAGFDCSTGSNWIYPTNYPLRDYQFNIVQKALFHNTLVTLPTGLGKTFIAAVVMYNFYRWYPQGKIVFMAPTKPLVAQQTDACYNIMGIPRQDTAELTGNIPPAKRNQIWQNKRVFFLTPQVFQNDLSRGSCRADDVVCLVFDEAHRALGNHSYCQVVREVLGYTKNFRVLALSATPGEGIEAVQDVISNLLISHIELRSEDSNDIKPYTHQRMVEKIVIKLGEELEFFKTKFLRVLSTVVNRLFNYEVLFFRDAAKVNKCILLLAREKFREKCAAGQQPQRQIGPIEGDFAAALSLYHSYDLLLQHGLLPFYKSIKEIADGSKGTSRAKTELNRNLDFISILDNLREEIESPRDQSDGNATTSDVSSKGINVRPSFVGHPKLVKVRDIVLEHFRACDSTNPSGNSKGSRVMIFSQFRDSVQEISRMLSQHQPLVKVMSFIGQQSKGSSSKGLTQKEQLEVVRKFRSGGYNTLVATCVAEEGLDIGEVDLIVCFDASASPIRLVQRMGRTGRKRDGRIIVLVTEGKEDQIYQRSQRKKASIHKSILDSAQTLELYPGNPRMIPKNFKPVCQKMFMTVEDSNSSKSKSKSTKTTTRNSIDGNIKKMFSASSKKDLGFLSPEELRYWNDNFKLPQHEAGLTPSRSSMRPRENHSSGKRYLETEPALSLTEWTAWQTPLQQVHYVYHSKRSRHFTEILEFCDFQRDCGDNGENYDLEMKSYLNREDIIEPGEEQASTSEYVLGKGAGKRNKKQKKNGRKEKDVVVGEVGEEKRNMDEENDGKNSMVGKGKESRSNKRKITDFDSDVDDDFEDVLPTNIDKDKTLRSDPVHSSSSLENGLEEISPTKKHTESSSSLPNNVSESNLSFVKKQSKNNNNVTAKNNTLSQPETARAVNEDPSEFRREWNDGELGPDNDHLTELLEIPSSQRQRKVTRSPMTEVLPDAPSLDTLLELSVLDTGENEGNFHESEERDFSPSMLTETSKTSKTYNNNNERGVTSKKAVFCEVSDGFKRITSEKSCGSKKSKNVERQEVSAKASESEKSIDVGSPIFGSGLVCDAGSRSKNDGGLDFNLNQELARSFFGDDDDIDHALCDIQTPSLFSDDDEREKTICKNKKQAFLHPQTERVNTTKSNLQTPCLFSDDDEDEWEKTVGRNNKQTSICLEVENVNTKTNNPRTPCVFDDEEFENENKKSNGQISKSFPSRSLYSEGEEFSTETENRTIIDERSKPRRKPLLERNIGCEKTNASRVNEHSLNKIKAFSFAKQTTEQAKTLNVTSGPRDEDFDMPDDFLDDVVPPSPPYPRRSQNWYSGEVNSSKSQSFRSNKELFSIKSLCGEKDHENKVKTCQNKRSMLQLRCKAKEKNEGPKSNHNVQVDAKIKLAKLELKTSPFKIASFSAKMKPKNKEKGTSQIMAPSPSLSQKKSELTANVPPQEAKNKQSFCNQILKDNQRNLLSKSKFKRTLFGKDQSKGEPKLEVGEPSCSRLSDSFLHEQEDEKIDAACLSPPVKSRSPFVCRKKDNVLLVDDKATKEPLKDRIPGEKSFKNSPRADEKLLEKVSSGGSDDSETISKAKCREQLCTFVKDSPLVVKRKSKCLRSRLLESEDEDDSGDEKSEYGDDNQNAKDWYENFDEEACVVSAGKPKRRSSLNQTKNTEEMSDSSDEFEEQETVKRKRKMPIHGQSKKNIAKKRRSLYDDFIDVEAEVSEEDDGHHSPDHEDGLSNEEMDDSFIDDRSQLTQRSPLMAMKQKKKDQSVNMMDIYRLSLLTPNRQQLRFQTPTFHRSKNRYKMVYNKPPPVGNIHSSTTDDEQDVSMASEESDEMEYGSPCDEGQGIEATLSSVSPDESQIVVRKNRRGKRRVLEESSITSPEATTVDSKHQTTPSPQSRPFRTTPTRFSSIEVKDRKATASIHSKDSHKSSTETDKAMFKRPTNTAPKTLNRGLNGVKKASGGYLGIDESIEDILAVLDDADDELLMMEISSTPSLNTGFGNNTLKKNCVNETSSNTLAFSSKTSGTISSDLIQRKISPDPSKPERTYSSIYSQGNATMNNAKRSGISSLPVKPNLSKSLQNPNIKEKPNEIFLKANENTRDGTANQTICKPRNSYDRNMHTVAVSNAKTGNKATNGSPLFPPLSTTTSSNFSSTFTHVRPGKTTAQVSGSEQTNLDKTDVLETTVNPSASTSPALTATQRDKNKLTILVGTKEVSNCQIVSLLRRKHNMKAVVSQISGCDYIVSTRMAVDRKSVSDISSHANFNKLIVRVRELCDLYDRPCIVIEKDRVKNGETQVKCEVRSKYYDRVLACLAQTHIKVLFSDSQEGTSDILASLAQVEGKKNHAIIYPLPLSQDKEQIVNFLSSIPRVSYITAISLCYHNKTLQELMNSSAEELVKRVKNISLKRANDILKFLQYGFCADMVKSATS